MTHLGRPFISTNDLRARNIQLLSIFNGAYTYRRTERAQPSAHADSQADSPASSCDDGGGGGGGGGGSLSRSVDGHATVQPLFPTPQYQQLCFHTAADPCRSVDPGAPPEQHRARGERLVLRLNQQGQWSLWLYQPVLRSTAEPDETLRLVSNMTASVEPVRGFGRQARQRVVLAGLRPFTLRPTMPARLDWDVCYVTLRIGPGVASEVAGKTAGFDVAWCKRRAQVSFDDDDDVDDVDYFWDVCRREVFEPCGEATAVQWLGRPDTDWDAVVPRAVAPRAAAAAAEPRTGEATRRERVEVDSIMFDGEAFRLVAESGG